MDWMTRLRPETDDLSASLSWLPAFAAAEWLGAETEPKSPRLPKLPRMLRKGQVPCSETEAVELRDLDCLRSVVNLDSSSSPVVPSWFPGSSAGAGVPQHGLKLTCDFLHRRRQFLLCRRALHDLERTMQKHGKDLDHDLRHLSNRHRHLSPRWHLSQHKIEAIESGVVQRL